MIKYFTKHKKKELVCRNFSVQVMKSAEHQKKLIEQGFIYLKQVFNQREVDDLRAVYDKVKQEEQYEQSDTYVNSTISNNANAKSYIRTETLKLCQPKLSQFLEVRYVSFPLGGTFCISPPNAKVGCRPHQDPSVVDESVTYSTNVWVALNDMTVENGCLHFIPGSHLWGNYYRSMSIEWAFNEFMDSLWKYMIPVDVKAGDVICFDSSIVHGSPNNQTDKTRLALSIMAIDNNSSLISCYPEKGLFKKEICIYQIDEKYFMQDSHFEKPASQYICEKKVPFAETYTFNDVLKLMNDFKRHN